MAVATLGLPRTVAAETLDGLAFDDPQAIHARRDLQRVHRVMRTRSILVRALRGMTAMHQQPLPLQVLELGAGDGTLMLGVARRLAPQWPRVALTLLDAQPLIQPETIKNFAALGWTATAQVSDVFDWVAGGALPMHTGPPAPHWDLILCNLFLHHFEGTQLEKLLDAIAARTTLFFACEPRRDWLGIVGSHLVGALGANRVTRHDAVLSVHAGFRARELTTLWPGLLPAWRVQEYPAAWFSHCFCAERTSAR